MRERLQKFDYRRSSYHRVTQRWVCGHAASGHACQIGPDAKGRCRADFECRPRHNPDGRWTCTRSEAAGGRCQDGPLPDGTCCRAIPKCQPVRSLSSQRRAISRWVLAVSIGLIAVAIGSSVMMTVFSPGGLSPSHGLLNDNCSTCHTAFDSGPSGWIHAAFFQNNVEADNNLCLACHNLGETPNAAHSQAPGSLRSAGLESGGVSGTTLTLAITRSVLGSHKSEEGNLSCMSCHTEHKGQNVDISLMSNEQCQSCHATAFFSFSQGHPNFGSYPYLRRTAIAFDHVSHLKKHFQDDTFAADAPTSCTHCHAPSIDGGMMVTAGFEESCALCHAGQIEGESRATSKGIAVLNAPGLDILTLAERGAPVGHWPEFAEEPPTPFMDLLLASDARYVTAKAVIDAYGDPLDLIDADDTVIAAATDLAWSVKELMHDLVVEGSQALQVRLEAALARELSTGDIALLGALLPRDAIWTSADAWFPGLRDEVARYRAGEFVSVPAPAEQTAIEVATASVRQLDDSADILDDDELSDGGDILSIADASDEEGILSLEGLDDGASDGDILGEDNLSGGEDILSGESGEPGLLTGSVEEESLPEAIQSVSGEDWASAGGWYREEFILRYRPTGHADGFLRAWIEQAAAARMPGTVFGERLFERVAGAKAPGTCVKCHSIDRDENGSLSIRWRTKQPMPHVRAFTRFSHAPHFSLLDEKGCLTCHALDYDAEYMEAFADRDPFTFSPNFRPVDKDQCNECHVPHEAGDSCVMCHNYHVGTFPPVTVSAAGMMERAEAPTSERTE